jgi:16S rRNA (uracil1498-N3)-methyltransferase
MLREDFRRKNFIVTHRFPNWPDQTGKELAVADRFFISDPCAGEMITIADEQAHHLIHVMRCKTGDEVVLFDRDGNEYDTQIVEVKKKQLTLARLSTRRPERKLPINITIAASLPKGDRQKFMIEKLVELGVANFIPLITPRSVAQVNAKVVGRIEKQIIEATKQCRRSYLMEVKAAMSLAEVISDHPSRSLCRYVAHPYNAIPIGDIHPQHSTQRSTDPMPPGQGRAEEKDASCIWLIGPEGGFSDDEVQQAVDAGWTAVCLGDIILRVETAAMVAAVASTMAPPTDKSKGL